jgi:hypothetical protein
MREARTPRAQTLGRPGTDLSTVDVQLQQPLTIAYRCGELAVCVWVDAIAVGFTGETTALVFYEVVGVGGLLATLAPRFESRVPAPGMMIREAMSTAASPT